VPASASFKLKGLKKGRYTVKVLVTFHKSLAQHKTATVKKTLTAQISVC
jgi:hypothetical protein